MFMRLMQIVCVALLCSYSSSRLGDVDDLPDMRVDAASPGPRVTFNIQDSVNLFFKTSYVSHMLTK